MKTINANTGKKRIIFKSFRQHLVDKIKENGWDWKANGGAKIMEYILCEGSGEYEKI